MRWHRSLKNMLSLRPIETHNRLKRQVLLQLEELETRALLSASNATAASSESNGVVHPLLMVMPQKITPMAGPSTSWYSPTQIEQAYGVSTLLNNGTNGKGETIAIVDAYYDPDLISDAKTFNTQFGLQQFNVSGGPTLTQIASGGGAGSSVAQDPTGGWDLETSLDVEWSHAIAPDANIVLVEAPDESDPSIFNAVQYAATKVPGVVAVSMSWGDYENSGETSYDSIFMPKSSTNPNGANPGVTFVAASGDSGAGAIYPAASPYVLAVGGTSLSTTTNSSGATVYSSETAWSDSGGGPAGYEGYPSYQYNQPSIVQNFGYPYNVEVINQYTGQTSYYSSRMTPDVAYNADPNTGYAIYDSIPSSEYGFGGGWTEVGGTSAGAPQWSALVALADQARGSQLGSLDTNQVLNTLYNSLSNTTSPPPVSPPPTSSPSASFVKTDTTTEGSWQGVYGSQGYNVIDNASSYPSYAQVSASGNSNYVWNSNTTDPRALQDASGSGRIAATWFSKTSFTVNVNLTDGQTHQLALYVLDWDHQGRSEEVELLNASTGGVLSTETVSNFQNGDYLVWDVSGNVEVRIIDEGGPNGVLSGLFIDPSGTPTSPPPTSSPSASFVKSDTTTEGSWKGVYGNQGFNVIDNASSYPSYAQVSATGTSNYVWTSSTTDPRALQDASGSGRIAATWFSNSSFTVNVNLTDGQTHQLALYLLDWGNNGRSEQVQIINAATGQVLSTDSVSNFSNGEYLVWDVSGDIEIKITNLDSKSNAVLSGLFFDPGPTGSNGNGNYANVFHDITTGSNGYDAGTGYDLATGLGTPIANNLVPLLAKTTIPQGQLPTITGTGYGGTTGGSTSGFGTTSFSSTSFFASNAGRQLGGGLYTGSGSVSIPPAANGANASNSEAGGLSAASAANMQAGALLTLLATPLTSSISTTDVLVTTPAAISSNLVGNVSTLASASPEATVGGATPIAAPNTPAAQANTLFGATGWNGSALSWRLSSLGLPGPEVEQLADDFSATLEDAGIDPSVGIIAGDDGGADSGGDLFAHDDALEPALLAGDTGSDG